MVGYKLSNNDWVTPFFVIFRSVREILLVTVFCKHPVENPPLRVSGTVAGSLLAAFMVQPRSGVTGGWSEINTFFAD